MNVDADFIVVAAEPRVRGVDRLSVVDASVMRIAEKAADILHGPAPLPPDDFAETGR